MSDWLNSGGAVKGGVREPTTPTVDATAIEPGTSILVCGPPMMGKRQFAVDIIGGSASRTAAIVSTKYTAQKVYSSLEATLEGVADWDISILDCTGHSQQFRQSPGYTEKRVSHPGDLTGVGIHLSGFFQEWDRRDVVDPHVQLHTLSTLLMYADLKRVFQFLYVIIARLQRIGAVGVFTLDSTTRQSDTFDRLAHLFDTVLEVRERDDTREYRVRGDDFGPSAWTPY